MKESLPVRSSFALAPCFVPLAFSSRILAAAEDQTDPVSECVQISPRCMTLFRFDRLARMRIPTFAARSEDKISVGETVRAQRNVQPPFRVLSGTHGRVFPTGVSRFLAFTFSTTDTAMSQKSTVTKQSDTHLSTLTSSSSAMIVPVCFAGGGKNWDSEGSWGCS